MLTGFRAGADPDIGVAADDFAGTRRAWALPADTAPIGRVFPDGAAFGPSTTPTQVITRLTRAAAPVVSAGMWPFLSLKPDPASVLAGQMDAHLTAIGKWAAGVGVPVYFSVHHEPENDTMGAPAADYLGRARSFVQVHTRAYRVIKAAAGNSIRMGPCHLVYKWTPGKPETADGAVAAAWRVPDDAADFVAGDSYTSNWSWASSGVGLADKKDFQRWLTAAAVPPAQLVLAERGISRTHSPGLADSQAAALIQDYVYLRDLGAHALLYWNSGGATDDSVFLLGAPGRAAFLLASIDAAAGQPPQPLADRYQAGYDAGVTAGLAEGETTGRQKTLRALGDWIATQPATIVWSR